MAHGYHNCARPDTHTWLESASSLPQPFKPGSALACNVVFFPRHTVHVVLRLKLKSPRQSLLHAKASLRPFAAGHQPPAPFGPPVRPDREHAVGAGAVARDRHRGAPLAVSRAGSFPCCTAQPQTSADAVCNWARADGAARPGARRDDVPLGCCDLPALAQCRSHVGMCRHVHSRTYHCTPASVVVVVWPNLRQKPRGLGATEPGHAY